MGKAQPHHLVAGLTGGYLPNLVEHYDTKGEALEALKDFVDRIDWDGSQDIRGRLADGYVTIGEWEYAGIEPCQYPDDCEIEQYPDF